MIGLGSVEIALVFWLCLAASAGCIIYGLMNWNQTGKEDSVKTADYRGEGHGK